MPNVIQFYRIHDPYGCFSNFAPYSVEIDGLLWPTTEHYFQAQKFADPAYRERIRQDEHPSAAKAVKDPFWTDGGDGSGENTFGRLLMELSAELRAGQTIPVA